jgi:hypothetical protein
MDTFWRVIVNVSSMLAQYPSARKHWKSRHFVMCRRSATHTRSLFQTHLKHSRISRRKQHGITSHVAVSVPRCHSRHIGVINHMNTKMILAAIALSLSLAACAKKEEPAEAAQDAAATANDAAGQAADSAADASAAAGDAASAAGDAAAAAGDAAASETPPAETPPQQ